MAQKDTILTGLRANGELHLGNYLGAMLPMTELLRQHSNDDFMMFVPDLHTIVADVDYGKLQAEILANVRMYVAAGLDITRDNVYLYRQSHIPAHSELAWILNCFTYYGELRRMTQFKEKAGLQLGANYNYPDKSSLKKSSYSREEVMQICEQYEASIETSSEFRTKNKRAADSVTAGLFNYPVLMAADILLYGAQYVPVGEDQRQHLELTRDLATRMNNKFGELFVVPHEWQKQLEFQRVSRGVRIRSLSHPENKMSKSIEDPRGTILLSDAPEEAAKKVMSATTDSLGVIHLDFDKQPGISNLLQILALLDERPLDEISSEWDGKDSYGELKQAVAKKVQAVLSDFQSKLAAVDDQTVLDKLASSEKAASKRANKTLARVQRAVGLRDKKSAAASGSVQTVSIDDFKKLDMRIATITQVERVDESDKLLRFELDFGGETQQVIAGMSEFFADTDVLVGQQIPVLKNLEAKSFRGQSSEGMIIAADVDGKPVLLHPAESIPPGSIVK